MEIMLSIKPKYIQKILTGEKTVEIRSRKMNLPINTKIWLYSTSPEKSIVGRASVLDYKYENREEIWSNHFVETAIDLDEYSKYTKNNEKVSAIFLGNVQPLKEKVSLEVVRTEIEGFQPPQFYKIIESNSILSSDSEFIS